jgi:hypothetical protein
MYVVNEDRVSHPIPGSGVHDDFTDFLPMRQYLTMNGKVSPEAERTTSLLNLHGIHNLMRESSFSPLSTVSQCNFVTAGAA